MAAGTKDASAWLVEVKLLVMRDGVLLVALIDVPAETNASAASCSKRVAANRRQSVAFIFLFRNPMGRLSRRIMEALLDGDPSVGERLVFSSDGILRFVPAATVVVGEG